MLSGSHFPLVDFWSELTRMWKPKSSSNWSHGAKGNNISPGSHTEEMTIQNSQIPETSVQLSSNFLCRKTTSQRDFPGGSVIKTPQYQCRGHRFDPWSKLRSYIPHTVQPETKKNNRSADSSRKLKVQLRSWHFPLSATGRVENFSCHRLIHLYQHLQ